MYLVPGEVINQNSEEVNLVSTFISTASNLFTPQARKSGLSFVVPFKYAPYLKPLK
jgi:hypothetical protein